MKQTTILFTLLFLSTILGAQTWVRQNPFAKLSQMYDIHFDGKHGLAVGADSTIFTTTNGGVNWVPRKAPIYARTIESAFVVPGTFGQLMFAGGDSILMKSDDGGVTWKTNYVEIPNVHKIQLLPGNILMVHGKDFGMYSTDNGLLWQPFNYPAFGVTAAHFVSIHVGWVALGAFDNVQVWYTEDGGFSWNLRDPQFFPLVSGIEMINDSVGFLASRDFVYKTIDGGFSWHPLNSIAANHIHDLHVIDENNLWAALDNGSVYFSTNGGSDWQETNPNVINSNRTYGIWADASGKVWTVGKYFSILHSPNFGVDWVDQIPANKQTLFEPNFYNALVGMVGGSDGVIMRTSNSGATWEAIMRPRDENFFGTVMLGDSSAIVGSTSGSVFITSDQGNTWTQIGEDLGQITDLHAFNRQTIVVTNEEGDIYKTSNGGNDWTKTYDGALILYAVDFANQSFGWAAGISGRILTTDDGGNSWDVQYMDGANDLSDIHFTTTQEGWATASNFSDSIWHTADGGTTWEKLGLPIKTFWHAVSFMDRDTGWVVGGSTDNGVIYRTNTRGQTWFLDHTSPDPFRGVYAIPNSETVWAVGFGGNIMKFSSCGTPPVITEIRGNLEPCPGDTINYVVTFTDVDVFDWTFPADWLVIGNANTASIHFIAGTLPGTVTVQGSDACGDTTIVLVADVFPVVIPEIIITEENGNLMTNATSGIYQWLFNGVPIPGANSPSYKPTETGMYQLQFETFTSGCMSTSAVYNFVLVSTKYADADQLMVYPNPAKDMIMIHYANGNLIQQDAEVMMANADGRIVLKGLSGGNQILIPDYLPHGMYILHIRTNEGLWMKKIIVE